MEVVRERYVTDVVGTKKNSEGRDVAIYGPEHKVGPTEKFEFGVPGDAMSLVIGGGYTSSWNVDFLQKELGKDGTCARFYFDKKVVVDIGDPEDSISKRKRKLLFRHGFGYLCIPSGFTQDSGKLRGLFQACIQEYQDYERRHPRPVVLQESTIIDEKGNVRRAMMTAVDIRVGGGLLGSVEKQAVELKEAAKLSRKEVKSLKLHSKLHKRLRRCLQSGIPFRNPFISEGKRLFPVKYAK